MMNSFFDRRNSAGEQAKVLPGNALAGHESPRLPNPRPHTVLGTSIIGPWEQGTRVLYLAMGCFWGAEEIYWRMPGVVSTAVGYMGGVTPNPSYDEVCTALTGHTETALIAYDPAKVTEEDLLRTFWEQHDPTSGNRQGNDVGTQYRSAIYWTTPEQEAAVRATKEVYAKVLASRGYDAITTELRPAQEAGPFFYAEDYHQQYLDKNPHGYRCHASTGVPYPASA